MLISLMRENRKDHIYTFYSRSERVVFEVVEIPNEAPHSVWIMKRRRRFESERGSSKNEGYKIKRAANVDLWGWGGGGCCH